MQTLRLNNGREIPCDVAEISPTMHILYLVFPEMGITETALAFCNDADTSVMTYDAGDGSEPKVFRGFTIIVDIVPETFGTRIGMRQPFMDEVAN